jgi:hypothetical protein
MKVQGTNWQKVFFSLSEKKSICIQVHEDLEFTHNMINITWKTLNFLSQNCKLKVQRDSTTPEITEQRLTMANWGIATEISHTVSQSVKLYKHIGILFLKVNSTLNTWISNSNLWRLLKR